MVEPNKNAPKSHDTKGTDHPTEPFMNLELPDLHKRLPGPLDEPIEVAEVIEEDAVADVTEAMPVVESVDEVLEVIEEPAVEIAAPSTDVSRVELVEDV